MEHIILTFLVTIPLAAILFIERKDIKKYVSLGLFTVIIAFVWEPIGVYFGAWYYNVWPQFMGVSVLTLFTYFHWITFSYFAGNALSRRFSK